MGCSVFLVLQTVWRTTLQSFLQFEVPGIKDLFGLIVLNQKKKKNQVSFLSVFYIFKSGGFTGAPLPKPSQQCFWVGILHTEIYNVLWEKRSLACFRETVKHIGLLLNTVNCTEILFDQILIKIYKIMKEITIFMFGNYQNFCIFWA